MSRRQRVLIADSSRYFDNAIWQRLLPETDFEIVGIASSTEAALSMAFLLRPDIILADLSHSAMPGLRTIEALQTALPDIPIVTFSPLASPEYTQAALQAGAAACLAKSDLAEALLEILHRLISTQPALPHLS